ncbi:MAG: DegT/DnrJ/EryC1/StrS family aminotransferase [Elusimicrobiota bacterium]
MKIPYVNLAGEHAVLKKEILVSVSKVIDRADFILGQEVARFERKIASYCGVKYAVGVNSGTDALFLAMKALGIGAGDEVITPPNSFLASTSTIIAAGARPVFVDVGSDMNINPDLIEKGLTKRTKAVMPVHLTGKPCYMDSILKIARRHHLYVIEDAAQSIGAAYKGKRTGSFGIAGCFSLHPLKTLNACGDAGFITTNNQTLYDNLVKLRNFGLRNRNETDFWGYNSRLDTLQAAILNVKLKYLDKWTSDRIKVAKYYIEKLRNYVTVPLQEKGIKQVFHTFIIRTAKRDGLQKYLSDAGIETKIHYPVPIHLQRAARGLGYKRGDFPVTEKQSKEILSLPVYPKLTRKQQDYIIGKIINFVQR